jgi:O-antigen/teichoic acid export membrane protein
MFDRLKLRGQFSRNVLTLFTGTTIAQLIPIAISPILSRIYTPGEFGIFALYMSVVTSIGVISTGRYEAAIVLPKEDGDAANLFAISICITLLVASISFFIFLLFDSQIVHLLGVSEITNYLIFVPLMVLLIGSYQSLSYWNNRKQKYREIGISKVLQKGLTAGSNLTLGMTGLGVLALILSGVFGHMLSVLFLINRSFKELVGQKDNVSAAKMIILSKRYLDFLIVNTPHALINVLKDFTVNILLLKFYSPFILGQFYMVYRIVLLPAGLIGASISQVLYRTIADKYNRSIDFSGDILNIVKILFLLAFLPVLSVVFWGEELFTLVLGENWVVGGKIASVLIIYAMFHFVAAPITVVAMVVEKQKIAFWWNLVGVVTYVMSFVVGHLVFNTLMSSIIILSISMSLFLVLYMAWVYKISKL